MSLTTLRDVARIVTRQPRLPKAPLAAGYVKAGLCSLRQQDRGMVRLFGLRVQYLNSTAFFKLYGDTFVSGVYDVDLEGHAPVIVDGGSNIGMTVLAFKLRYPHARIMAFEPNPEAFETLETNIAMNNLADVELHQTALGDSDGRIEIRTNDEVPGALNAGSFAPRRWTHRSVRLERLSGYINGEVDLLKLDVEGAEVAVLSDLAASGKLRNIRNIVCEYGHDLPKDTNRLGSWLVMLEEYGFVYHVQVCGSRPPVNFGSLQDVMIYAKRP